jgi:ABC-2 type transport system ATP-binding protein
VLDEVERFGSRVLVMVQSRLAAEGDYRAIRDLMDDRPHRVRIRTNHPRAVATGLLETGAVMAVELVGEDTIVVETTTVQQLRRQVAVVAQRASATLIEILPLDDDLESVFRYLVAR